MDNARRSYENFDVRIEKSGEAYCARVWADSVGEGKADVDLAPSLAQLDGFLFNVGQARRRSRGPATTRASEAEKFGGGLFDSVFRGDALGCLQQSVAAAQARGVGTRIRMRLADVPELSDMPWEFLYSRMRKEFLSLSSYTPIVRYLECPEAIRPLSVAPPLRILAVICSPDDYPRLDVEREWTSLQDSLDDLVAKKLVVLERLEKPQLAMLPRALKKNFHVLHFIGHGEFTEAGGELVFEDEWRRGKPVAAERLATILRDQLSLRLVVLNACEGARSSRTDPFSGVAQTLVRQGIPAVLAMQFEITDEAAITIASEFYTSVAVGDPIDTALADARLKLYALQDDGVEWATPVLYLRAQDGRIFDVAQTGTVVDKRVEAAPAPESVPEPASKLVPVALPPRSTTPPKSSTTTEPAVGGPTSSSSTSKPSAPGDPWTLTPSKAADAGATPRPRGDAPVADPPPRKRWSKTRRAVVVGVGLICIGAVAKLAMNSRPGNVVFPTNKDSKPITDQAPPSRPVSSAPTTKPFASMFQPLHDIVGRWSVGQGIACTSALYGDIGVDQGRIRFEWHVSSPANVAVERVLSVAGPIVTTVVESDVNTSRPEVGQKVQYDVDENSLTSTNLESGATNTHERC